MSDPTTRRRGGPDTTTMRGSINERIREVLQFMKTRGFTSVSSFLVAMCDSRAHDIKHLTGIMLGSRGVFTELVESLFAADNATALFKLTYDSHMCILARKVTFDKLRTELDCIGKHRELRRPASDFAEVDWESLDFGSIGEAFRRAAPATTELVEQLCGVTAVTADCPARSRGRYTGGSAVGDAEDHWGLDSPAPLEKRKMISVVAMSLLGYANSQRANILQVIGV
jgi:hypothetical protein